MPAVRRFEALRSCIRSTANRAGGSMAKMFKVTFQPDAVSIDVRAGTTILKAANKAGVFVNSLCGGDGVCGRCRVIVREGVASGGTTESFTREEIRKGYILASLGCSESDLVARNAFGRGTRTRRGRGPDSH